MEATTTWLVLKQLAGTHSFRHLEFLQLQCFLELPLLGLFLPRCLHKHYASDCEQDESVKLNAASLYCLTKVNGQLRK